MVMEPDTTIAQPRSLTPRAEKFVQLIIAGTKQYEAYRKAYKKPKLLPHDAAERACQILARFPRVKARLAELRGQSAYKAILSLNDRLAICAKHAQTGSNKPEVQLKAVDLYTKLAGDSAPDKLELSGPEGGAITVDTTVQRLPIRQRIAAMIAARKQRDAAG